MKHQTKCGLAVGLVGLVLILSLAMTASANRGNGDLSVVYVESQGLFFDTFVPVNSLPNKGRFQLLIPGGGPGGTGLTEFGPGDQGYVGGRWWIDNGDIVGVRDANDTFLLCPLLGPGRPMP